MLIRTDNGGLGIVTDRDLGARAFAEGISADTPVREVMTTPVVTVGAEETGADVMIAMLDHDIRHVPVLSARSEVLGVIVGIDLVAAEARTPFVLRRAIAEATDEKELREAARRLRSAVIALHRAELAPAQISQVISVVADALIRRLIELAIDSEGTPPAEFCWMALGSHGRREAVPSSDVDSGMSWREAPDPDPIGSRAKRVIGAESTARYMHAIAAHVADGIRVVGWKLDPHGVTASGSFSASSIEDWHRAIQGWITHPGDERVLTATSILLDGRTVQGPDELNPKPAFYRPESRPALLRSMLRLALARKPPTGFRRDIVVEDGGEHRGTFDIKHGGLLPIVDLARYAALVAEVEVTPTVERLRAGGESGAIKPDQARVLEEAYDLFAGLRLEHQVQQLEREAEPDDHLDPRDLNPLSRRYLRDAFREVRAVQRSLAARLTRGSLMATTASPAAHAYESTPEPAPSTPWRDATFSVIDLELTGLDPAVHEIVSFATVTVTGGTVRLADARYRIVRPRRMPDAASVRIHGLRESDLAAAPPLEEVLDDLLEALTGRVLVAHVARVEEGFCAPPSKPVGWPSATRLSIPPPWRWSYAGGGTTPAGGPSIRALRHSRVLARAR